MVSIAYMFTHSTKLNINFSLSMVALLLLSKVSVLKIIKTLIPVTIAAFGLFMTAYVFSIHQIADTTSVNTIQTYDYAWLVSSRVYVFALLGMMFSFTTNMDDFLFSLRDQLGLSDFFIYGIFASINVYPTIKQEVKKNRFAFKARGQTVSPYSSKVLIPLFTKIILYSDRLAIAMESKGFYREIKRSQYKVIEEDWLDYCFMIVCAVLSFLLIKVK